ncbi:unnamed protein product, partial [marine sediment metagenome]
SIDGGPFSNMVVFNSDDYNLLINTDGNHDVNIWLQDNAGNDTNIFIYSGLDKDNPTILSIDGNGLPWNSYPFNILFDVDFEPSGESNSVYRIDDGAWQDFNTGIPLAAFNNSSLKAIYKMNDASGGPVDSRNSNDMTVAQGSPNYEQTGQIGTSIETTSGNTVLITPSGGDFNFGDYSNPFSISLWIANWPLTTGPFFVSQGLENQQSIGIKLGGSSGANVTFRIEDETTTKIGGEFLHGVTPGASFNNFVFTYDGSGLLSGMNVYVDGIKTTMVLDVGDASISGSLDNGYGMIFGSSINSTDTGYTQFLNADWD